MGAFDNGKGGITLLSNHEVATNDAIAKKSASTTSTWGTTITKFNYSPNSRSITSASNLFHDVNFWNYSTGTYQKTPIGGEPKNAAKDTFGWESAVSAQLHIAQKEHLFTTALDMTERYLQPAKRSVITHVDSHSICLEMVGSYHV